ncbi:hypothetical protein [Marinomonas sp. PE14-40]|uniref:hypothetical protein n=1 Tax=Marinomonas sp. PE14-40 TaxID=3060621 RepID=UPI003F6661BF
MKTEILLSFLLGSMPIVLARNQQDFSAVKILASLNPGDFIVKYFVYLLCIHLVVWFVNQRVLKTNQTLSLFFQKLHEFTYKLGFAIHGIYRALAGAVPVAMVFEIEKYGFAQGWKVITVYSVVLSIICLCASLALSRAAVYTAPRKSLFYR